MLLKGRPLRSGSRIMDYRRLNDILMKDVDRKKILITRRPPFEIHGHNVHPIWLAKVSHPSAVHPSRLHVIEQAVWEHLQQEEADVVLDAVEYLIIENGVEPTLRFVSKLRDIALLMNSDFYVTVGGGLDDRVFNILKRIVE
ncbi:DUF835 domain-containing protein [Thermococcus sp. GR6]|uniref:DUF835 domain-containing protein n=1 Tax=Thermococcus sp. GR6 TaxID=1638256 RepID=UPI001F0DA78E|nr:DUF835 domain-containing protein [Thermococcus sp. GR6]